MDRGRHAVARQHWLDKVEEAAAYQALAIKRLREGTVEECSPSALVQVVVVAGDRLDRCIALAFSNGATPEEVAAVPSLPGYYRDELLGELWTGQPDF